MAQTYTSASTSINRNKLPAVYGKAHFSAKNVLDYGCGAYTEHIRQYVESMNKIYLPYDPYNQSIDEALDTRDKIHLLLANGCPIDIVCSNVLNVIDDEEEINGIAKTIMDIIMQTGGYGFVTVYEGNRSGVGRATGKDQYQRNEPLKSYLKYFSGHIRVRAKVKNGMIFLFK